MHDGRRPHVQIRAERYAIGRTLGHGGMATVYLARDRALERPVALKVLAAHLANDEPFRRRFVREARLAAKLVHQHIVQVYDVGEDEYGPFIVTEYVDGITLAEELDRRGHLPPEQTAAIGIQLCSALEAAHAAGLVHRDVKPQNILRGREGQLKLADFGIARSFVTASETETGTVLGTAAYLAPEQARGESVTPAADLYALGVVLYELLTGQTPFPADSLPQLLLEHERSTPTPPSELAPGVPGALDAVVLGCLAFRPEQRPASAATLARRLAAAIDDAQTKQLPSLAPTRTQALAATVATATRPLPRRRLVRRRRLGAAAVLLVLALAGLLTAALLATAGGRHTPKAAGHTTLPIAATKGASAPSATTASGTTTSASTTADTAPPPASNPDQALANALAAITQAEASGQLDPKAANELSHRLDDITRSLAHPNGRDAGHKTAGLLRHLDNLARHGRITNLGLTEIAAPLDQLAIRLTATTGPPGQNDNGQDPGDNDNG